MNIRNIFVDVFKCKEIYTVCLWNYVADYAFEYINLRLKWYDDITVWSLTYVRMEVISTDYTVEYLFWTNSYCIVGFTCYLVR